MENNPDAITTGDVKVLKEILTTWDSLSNADKPEDGYPFGTDHCHDTFDAGWSLLGKLERNCLNL